MHGTAVMDPPKDARNSTTPGAVKAKLYGLRGSAPSFSPELMLRHKGIGYRRVNLMPGRHGKALLSKGFPGGTVPAIMLNGRRVQTNRAIARALDDLVPDPPLFPADPVARADVEAAERYGDEVLQPATRRMILWSMTRDPDSVTPHPANGRLPIPRNRWLRSWLMPRVFAQYGITDSVVREDFEALHVTLDKIDAYMADGVLDSAQLTAADFEIAPLIGALLGIESCRSEMTGRRVAALARRVLP
jgi:glutathione S-transferase